MAHRESPRPSALARSLSLSRTASSFQSPSRLPTTSSFSSPLPRSSSLSVSSLTPRTSSLANMLSTSSLAKPNAGPSILAPTADLQQRLAERLHSTLSVDESADADGGSESRPASYGRGLGLQLASTRSDVDQLSSRMQHLEARLNALHVDGELAACNNALRALEAAARNSHDECVRRCDKLALLVATKTTALGDQLRNEADARAAALAAAARAQAETHTKSHHRLEDCEGHILQLLEGKRQVRPAQPAPAAERVRRTARPWCLPATQVFASRELFTSVAGDGLASRGWTMPLSHSKT